MSRALLCLIFLAMCCAVRRLNRRILMFDGNKKRSRQKKRKSYTYCMSRRNFRGGIHLRVR